MSFCRIAPLAQPTRLKPLIACLFAWTGFFSAMCGTFPALAGYREDHIDLYRITQPPMPTGHQMIADYESAWALIIGWKTGTFDPETAALIGAVSPPVSVVVLADSSADVAAKTSILSNYGVSLDSVTFEIIETESQWVGGDGPLPIRHDATNEISLVDPRYLDPLPLDDKVPTELAAARNVNVFRPSVLLPRGVAVDGNSGSLLCLFSERDVHENLPDPDWPDFSALMADYLGCGQIVTLPSIVDGGLGALSQALRFIGNSTVLVGEMPPGLDCPNADRLDAIANHLESIQTPGGGSLDVLRITFPPDTDGVFRSYTDFVMVNGITVIPSYPDFPSFDAAAMAVFNAALPGWQHHMVDSREIVAAGGSLKMMTSILPLGIYSPNQAPPGTVCGDQASCQWTGCGSITYEGYCDGDTVIWCEDQQVHFQACSTPCVFVPPGTPCEQRCGWSPAGFFDCIGPYDCGQPEIFFDGFESGDTGAWSTVR